MPNLVKIQTLNDVIALAARNPALARQLKERPSDVAQLLGVDLSEQEAGLISERLDIEHLLRFATETDSFAAKVAQGIGLRANEN